MGNNRSYKIWRVVILLCAGLLRFIALGDAPPGLTHDEAVHGLTAWSIVGGERAIYFTIAYGREPLYDYMTAVLMGFMGPTFVAGRMTSAFFSLIMISGSYALARRLFNERVALMTMAGLAIGFWPLMTARHMLRTITMPALFVLAVYFWWMAAPRNMQDGSDRFEFLNFDRYWTPVLASGLLLGITFYTYLPARLMWALLPFMLLVWLLYDRPKFWAMWRPTLAILSLSALISVPMFLFLWTNPDAEVRVGQLTGALDAARNGEWLALGLNMMEGVRIIPFVGDTAWRYNIPERPLLSPFMAGMFGLSLLLVLRRMFGREREGRVGDRDGYWLIFAWLLLGLLPVFITGSFLGNTRAIAIQPILFMFPALFLEWMWRMSEQNAAGSAIMQYGGTAVALIFVYTGLESAQSYFFDWAQHPEVRVQYESSLVEAIDYVNLNNVQDVAFSTTTPGIYHSPPVALLTLHNTEPSTRWFNGQHSLVIPASDYSTLIFSGFAPLSPSFENYLDALDPQPAVEISMLDADLDQPILAIEITDDSGRNELLAQFDLVNQSTIFLDQNNAVVEFAGQNATLSADALRVDTLWKPQQAVNADLVLFMQLLGPDGLPVTQSDRLDVPATGWLAGDWFIQQHTLQLPADLPAGNYRLIAGYYERQSEARLTAEIDGEPAGDFIDITEVDINR